MRDVLTIAFAGAFAARLEPAVRAHVSVPCEVIVGDEAGIVAKLGRVDALITMAFTREMAAAAGRLKLVQVPGAGLDRIDRAALSPRPVRAGRARRRCWTCWRAPPPWPSRCPSPPRRAACSASASSAR